MSKRTRFRARNAARHAAMVETLAQWARVFRGERSGQRIVADLMKTMAGALSSATVVTKDDLYRAYQAETGIRGIKQAIAEVDQYSARAAERLRREEHILIHPVTDVGLTQADVVGHGDVRAANRCIPGRAGPEETAGWRRAHRSGDPALKAYVNMRFEAGAGGVERTFDIIDTAATAGILPAPTARPALPDKVA